MFDIISVGSATRDVFVQCDGFSSNGNEDMCFTLGSKIEIHKMELATGGGGTNYAVTFARQGFKTACVGVIGNDPNGDAVLSELDSEGIDTSMFIRHTDDLTAYSVILVHPSSERTILSYKGEGQHFASSQIDFSKLQTKWLFLDSLGGHYDLFEKLVDHAVKNNIKIACNPGGKELAHGMAKLKPLFKNMDIVLMNKEEAGGLLDIGHDALNIGEIAENLKTYVKGIVSVSDGPNGVTVIDTDGKTHTAGIPNTPVVERTGAGDAFGSGFISEFIRSQDIEKAIQLGTDNASSVVMYFGAKRGILKKGEILKK